MIKTHREWLANLLSLGPLGFSSLPLPCTTSPYLFPSPACVPGEGCCCPLQAAWYVLQVSGLRGGCTACRRYTGWLELALQVLGWGSGGLGRGGLRVGSRAPSPKQTG